MWDHYHDQHQSMHAAPVKRWMEVKDSERLYTEDIVKYEEPTPAKGIRVPSTIIIRMEGEGDIQVKDEYGDIWCEATKSKTYLEYDIPKELWGNWPMKEEANIACGCKDRNFWNCSARVLGSVTEPHEVTAAILWCGGL